MQHMPRTDCLQRPVRNVGDGTEPSLRTAFSLPSFWHPALASPIHTRTHAHTHTNTYVCMCTCILTHACARARAHTHTQAPACSNGHGSSVSCGDAKNAAHAGGQEWTEGEGSRQLEEMLLRKSGQGKSAGERGLPFWSNVFFVFV